MGASLMISSPDTILRAIPAEYRGIQFRSRLEARYAVWLDSLDVRWEYEREGFQLDAGWYVPDFWLPQYETWLEVKPAVPTGDEQAKARELFRRSQQPVIVAEGGVHLGNVMVFAPICPDGDETWIPWVCSECHQLAFIHLDTAMLEPNLFESPNHIKNCNCIGRTRIDSQLLHAAYEAARKYRAW